MDRITSADGTLITWVRNGSGPDLLLVHGTTADHTRWDGIGPRLAERFTVHAMDRRGRGGSGDGPVYAVAREAEDVASVVEAIGGSVALLGHSYGAVCALEAALLTDSIGRLILYEPPIPTGVPMYPPGLPDEMQTLLDAGEDEAALELFFREVVGMPDHEMVEYRKQPMWRRRVELARTIPRELAIDGVYEFDPARFVGFDLPTLLLLGGDSPAMFRRAADVVVETLHDLDVVILPGQQHIAMDTAPDLFLDEVVGFLDR